MAKKFQETVKLKENDLYPFFSQKSFEFIQL